MVFASAQHEVEIETLIAGGPILSSCNIADDTVVHSARVQQVVESTEPLEVSRDIATCYRESQQIACLNNPEKMELCKVYSVRLIGNDFHGGAFRRKGCVSTDLLFHRLG